MPRPSKSVPSYLHHRASGQAYCTIRRADGSREQVYLGVYGSPESRTEYARILAVHTSPTPSDPSAPALAPAGPITVAELIVRYLEHAWVYYRRPDGTSTNEVLEYRQALRPVRFLFGALPVGEFGPVALQRVRDLMVTGYTHDDYGPQEALSRGVVNQRIGRIKRVFKWGTAQELVPASVFHGLASVSGLKSGRSNARETEPINPVAWEIVEKTLPKLNPIVRAMVLFQWHTGCRPGEVCSIRAAEIDRSGSVWLYRPSYHKLAYRGRPRVIAIGKQGQAVLAPFLGGLLTPGGCQPDGCGNPSSVVFLFSPAVAVETVRADQRSRRKTKRYPSQQKSRSPKPKRKPSGRYATSVYDRAIVRACKAAGIEPWHPNQLRHAFATRARRAGGLEAAQALLGHASADITQVYAERDLALAVQVAGEIG